MIHVHRVNRLVRTQLCLPLRLRVTHHFHGRIQHRILLTAVSQKQLHIQYTNFVRSVKSMTKLLRSQPCRENSIGDFCRQSGVERLAQRIRSLIHPRRIKREIAIHGGPLGYCLNILEDWNGAINCVLNQSCSIRGAPIPIAQTVLLSCAALHPVLDKHNADRYDNRSSRRRGLCEGQPISTVPAHA